MKLKKIMSLILLMTCSLYVFSQKWTQEINQDFRNSKTFAVTIDFTNLKICGMPLEQYRGYFAEKYNLPENYVDLMLETFEYNMRQALWYKSRKKLVSVNQAAYELVVHIDEITEKAGYNGYFCVRDKIDDCTTKTGLRLVCKGGGTDGSESSFEKALLKNASKKIKHLHVPENPFFFPFFECE